MNETLNGAVCFI